MMKSIFWNFTPVNTQHAFTRLQILNSHHKFFLIVLMEPFQQAGQIQRFMRKLNMQSVAINISGKVWFFLRDNVDMKIISDSDQQISIKIMIPQDLKHMLISMVYAKCKEDKRIPLWNTIYNLANINLPWLVGG